MDSFMTLKGLGEATFLVNKSLFTAHAARIENEQEAIRFIETAKKKYWDATHNCSAYVLAGMPILQKADDNGEPSGTAGKPILEVLHNRKIKNAVVVVTRYFGGIKLGAGGLIRAYSKAATMGIDAAGIVERSKYKRYRIEIDYPFLGSVENNLHQYNYYIIESKNFTASVELIVLEKKESENLISHLADWTSGQAAVTFLEEQYVDLEIPKNNQFI